MLIDDNPDDNFFHERVIRKNDSANIVIAKESGSAALDYLKNKSDHPDAHPDLIFLDLNMPEMNGWNFLDRYNQLDEAYQSKIVVIMLTTSDNPDDIQKGKSLTQLAGFKTKPLTPEMLNELIDQYF